MDADIIAPDPVRNASDVAAGIKAYVVVKTVRGGKQYGRIFNVSALVDRLDHPVVDECKRALAQTLDDAGIFEDAAPTSPRRGGV